MARQECAHPDCECMVEDDRGIVQSDETYCSSYCARSGPRSGSKECECGHAECA